MALTRITLRQFEAFLAIVDLHSIGAAAERLGLTSSAVSQLLSELEAELGFRLFDRTTRRVNLSSAGRDFLSSAESVLRHVRAAAQSADDIRNRAAGIVRWRVPPCRRRLPNTRGTNPKSSCASATRLSSNWLKASPAGTWISRSGLNAHAVRKYVAPLPLGARG